MEHETCLEIIFHSNARIEPTLLTNRNDKEVRINKSISGTEFHKLRVVIDNESPKSAKVFLDDRYFGSYQEPFVARLKGGVFVLNKFKGVALFKNFTLNGCRHFNKEGRCTDNDGRKIFSKPNRLNL